MKHLLLALFATAAFAAVRPARVPPVKPASALDQLLQGQVRHIMQEGFPTPLPNPTELPVRARTGAVYAAATCLQFAGCEPKAQTKQFAISLLSELARTHVTGGGVTQSGEPWGNHWQSAFWAYEAAFGAWLLWDDLPDALRAQVVKLVTHEADRFIDLPPPYSEFLDTKAEENSWNSLILIFAAETMPDHPHAHRWRERGIEYTISSTATRADRKSARLVGGRPLSSWVRGANVHDDFTMENHGFVHPDYMTTISQNLTHALVYRLTGQPVPQALLHNAQPSYDILKVFSMRDGSLFYPNSTDWNLHHLDHAWNVHILAAQILRDPDAASLAGLSLDTLRKMQARTPSGRLFVPGEYTAYGAPEQHSAFLVASGLIAAKLWPPVAKPRPIDEVFHRLHGVKVYDDGRLFISRTRDAISSFAWGLRIMGQTIPFTLDPVLHPLNRSYVGLAGELPPADDRPGRLALTTAALDRAIGTDPLQVSSAIVSEEEGGVSVVVSARQANLRRQFSFIALPTGPSIFMERFGTLNGALHSGMIAMLEDSRWVYGTAQRKIEQGTGWLNVDNRLGYVILGAGAPPLDRTDLRTRLLFLNPQPAPSTTCAIITLPNTTAAETRNAASRIVFLETGSPLVSAVRVGDYLVVTSFDGVGHTNAITAGVQGIGRPLAVPVNGGATRILRLTEK